MAFWNFFKKATAEKAEDPQPSTASTVEDIQASTSSKAKKVRVSQKPKQPRKVKEQPEVKVVNFNFNSKNPREGAIELDWNDEFVVLLRAHGYQGEEPEDIVNAWLSDVCRTIASNEEFAAGATARYIQRKDLGHGKSEFS
jgi:hypothetical protein